MALALQCFVVPQTVEGRIVEPVLKRRFNLRTGYGFEVPTGGRMDRQLLEELVSGYGGRPGMAF